jgi:hypothetical protein
MLFGDFSDETEILEQLTTDVVWWKALEILPIDRVSIGNRFCEFVEKVGIVFLSHPALEITSGLHRLDEVPDRSRHRHSRCGGGRLAERDGDLFVALLQFEARDDGFALIRAQLGECGFIPL